MLAFLRDPFARKHHLLFMDIIDALLTMRALIPRQPVIFYPLG